MIMNRRTAKSLYWTGAVVLAVLFLPWFARSLPAGDKPGWARDLDAAKKDARDSAKDLLIVFTGHGWCYHCDLMDREVFQQDRFLKQAGKRFVGGANEWHLDRA
jgi:thioredoxin-related protein